MLKSIPIGVIKYFQSLIKKVLTDGTKITKNDLIDSQFMSFYPFFELITVDDKFLKVIYQFDKNLAERNRKLKKRILN